MSLAAYVPKRRHFRLGRGDGYLCVGCDQGFRTMWSLWPHKIRRRHPFLGDGRTRTCRPLGDGTWAPATPAFVYRVAADALADLADQIDPRATALTEAHAAVHVIRFARQDGEVGGPDTFYAGVVAARAQIRRLIQDRKEGA